MIFQNSKTLARYLFAADLKFSSLNTTVFSSQEGESIFYGALFWEINFPLLS